MYLATWQHANTPTHSKSLVITSILGSVGWGGGVTSLGCGGGAQPGMCKRADGTAQEAEYQSEEASVCSCVCVAEQRALWKWRLEREESCGRGVVENA